MAHEKAAVNRPPTLVAPIRRRAAAPLAALCLGLGLGACSGFPGSHHPSHTAKPTPVTDEYICGGVLSTQQLKETLDYEVFTYRYNNSPTQPKDGGGSTKYDYTCNTTTYSNSVPFWSLELNYSSDDSLKNISNPNNLVYFDDVPSRFPDSAKAVELDGKDGEGLSWITNNGAHIAWRYPDGTMLDVYLAYEHDRPVTPEQQDALLQIFSPLIDTVPPIAAGPPDEAICPTPTPT